jgi:hypothetical protein
LLVINVLLILRTGLKRDTETGFYNHNGTLSVIS